MSIDIPFEGGYIKDEWARLVEPVHRAAEGRPYLWTGRRAEVGQRTETQVTVADGGWCRLSGVVTDVGAMPTLDEWRGGGSRQLTLSREEGSSGLGGSAPPPELSADEQSARRDDSLERFGTLHGQTVTSYAFLNCDFYDRQEGLPFKRARVYRVSHAANDSLSFFWCVTKIEDVTDLPREDLPEAFSKWVDGSRVVSRRPSALF